jgi:hypothetical protein
MLVDKKEAFPVKMSNRDYTFWDSLILYGFVGQQLIEFALFHLYTILKFFLLSNCTNFGGPYIITN